MDYLEKYENAQAEAAIAYAAYGEVKQKRKDAMLDAYREIRAGGDAIDAETAFFSFGQFDADAVLAKLRMAETPEDRNEVAGQLAAPFIWTAFQILDELRKEGKIKEGE